jgi:ATP-dependent DNA helicase recG
MDLKLRGPGDFFGARQHGLPELKIADLTDMDGLDAAQQAAQKILEESPDLSTGAARSLRAEIRRLFGRVGENGLN